MKIELTNGPWTVSEEIRIIRHSQIKQTAEDLQAVLEVVAGGEVPGLSSENVTRELPAVERKR